jgi:uncharacterized membrane protein
MPAPSTGVYTIAVSANALGAGPRQSYALVLTGDVSLASAHTRAVRH